MGERKGGRKRRRGRRVGGEGVGAGWDLTYGFNDQGSVVDRVSCRGFDERDVPKKGRGSALIADGD